MTTTPVIKHLILSGGGPLGLRYLGALEKLEQLGRWKIENIESIYATSIGSILGAFLCLRFDWDTLNKYIVDRPWHEAIAVNATQLLNSYFNKGLFDKKVMEIIFKPLLHAKDLALDITLAEFYAFSNIRLCLFTFEVNAFETVCLSHETHPTLGLLEALTMSSALPGLFMPTILDNKCYIDGGVMCNYPLNYCLERYPGQEAEMLGVKGNIDNEKRVVQADSSLLEYVMCLTANAMHFIRNTVKVVDIENTVVCQTKENPLTLEILQEALNNRELREKWIRLGEADAMAYIGVPN